MLPDLTSCGDDVSCEIAWPTWNLLSLSLVCLFHGASSSGVAVISDDWYWCTSGSFLALSVAVWFVAGVTSGISSVASGW